MKKTVFLAAALLAASAVSAQTYQMRHVSRGLVAPLAALTVSAPSAFPSTARNTPAAPQLLTVTNTGNVPVSVSAANITAGATDFTATLGSQCANIPVGSAQCTISVGFTPTLAGPRTGTLSVTSTAATATAPITLTGEGSGPTQYVLHDSFEGTTVASTTTNATISYGTSQAYEGTQYLRAVGSSGRTFAFNLPVPANATNVTFSVRQALVQSSSYTRTLFRSGCPVASDNATIGMGGAYAGFSGTLNWGLFTIASSNFKPGCNHVIRWNFGTDPELATAGFAFDAYDFAYTLN